MYGKLFVGMYDGTLATEGPWEALVTFQQLIILADKFGNVDMTPEAIARRTTIPMEFIVKGLEALEKPDSHSRTPDEEGRRIVRLSDSRPWGWRVVNHAHYRKIRSGEERQEYMKLYQREYRKQRKPSVNSVKPCKSGKPIKPISESNKQKAISKKNSAISDKPKRPALPSYDQWWEEIKKNPAYTGINLDHELAKMELWLAKPENHRRKLTPKFALNWLNRIEQGDQGRGSLGHSQTCTHRVPTKGRLKPCAKPATHDIGHSSLCEKCFKDYQRGQGNFKQGG